MAARNRRIPHLAFVQAKLKDAETNRGDREADLRKFRGVGVGGPGATSAAPSEDAAPPMDVDAERAASCALDQEPGTPASGSSGEWEKFDYYGDADGGGQAAVFCVLWRYLPLFVNRRSSCWLAVLAQLLIYLHFIDPTLRVGSAALATALYDPASRTAPAVLLKALRRILRAERIMSNTAGMRDVFEVLQALLVGDVGGPLSDACRFARSYTQQLLPGSCSHSLTTLDMRPQAAFTLQVSVPKTGTAKEGSASAGALIAAQAWDIETLKRKCDVDGCRCMHHPKTEDCPSCRLQDWSRAWQPTVGGGPDAAPPKILFASLSRPYRELGALALPVRLDETISFPIALPGGSVRLCDYSLAAFFIHDGPSPVIGHYLLCTREKEVQTEAPGGESEFLLGRWVMIDDRVEGSAPQLLASLQTATYRGTSLSRLASVLVYRLVPDAAAAASLPLRAGSPSAPGADPSPARSVSAAGKGIIDWEAETMANLAAFERGGAKLASDGGDEMRLPRAVCSSVPHTPHTHDPHTRTPTRAHTRTHDTHTHARTLTRPHTQTTSVRRPTPPVLLSADRHARHACE